MKPEDVYRAMDKAESISEKVFILLIDLPKPFTALVLLYFAVFSTIGVMSVLQSSERVYV